MPSARLRPRSNAIFDLRYHVASLAAVFVALVIGILVGVGISGRGVVEEADRALLQDRIDRLERQLELARLGSEQQGALRSYERETYAAIMRDRLRDRTVAVIFVGSVDGRLGAIEQTLEDAGGSLVRLRALRLPVDPFEVERAVARVPDVSFRIEDVARALAQELVNGGATPLWDAVGSGLVEERSGSMRESVDAVVVARTVEPQRGATARFLAGFYAGLASAGVPVIGVERSEDVPSAIETYGNHGFSTVDTVETSVGRVALAVLLEGRARGHYGIKETADDVLPDVEPVELPPE